MLAFKSQNAWVRWTGQVINDIQYGANIETAWTDEELLAIGLHRIIDHGVPAGKVSTSSSLSDVDGEPTMSHSLADIPPPELTKRQLCAGLIVSGKTTDPDGFVRGLIAVFQDPVQKALALNDWENAPYYVRSHPLFTNSVLLAQAGMTSADVDQLWALGASQAA